MTEFGKALWLAIQDKGAYTRSSFARLLGEKTGWEPSRQSVSHWLKGERDVPRELVPATAIALGLDEATQRSLEHLYFYGQNRANSKFTIPVIPKDPPFTAEENSNIAEYEERVRERHSEETTSDEGEV